MAPRVLRHITLTLTIAFAVLALNPSPATAKSELPETLTIADSMALARDHRNEVAAARARAEAAGERPTIVAALEDPMLSFSVDHFPFDDMGDAGAMNEAGAMNGGNRGGRYDWSYSVEQRFPLSGVRGHRRRAAEAEAAMRRADAERATRDVELHAASAYLMLQERRQMAKVALEQQALARQLTAAAAARYAAGQAGQVDLLRAEVESARADAEVSAIGTEISGAEAMLNAAIGRDVWLSIPPLASTARDESPPGSTEVVALALERRPELQAGAAEIDRASAEADVMRSMYRPMGMLRLGRASTMAEGDGAMVMVGVSLPVWRDALRAGVREADAMRRMAQADLVAMRRMVEGEAIAARERVEAMRLRFKALRDDVAPRARSAVQSSLAAYRSGQSDLVAVIEAMRALWAVQGELVMVEAELGLAWARLERAIGGPGKGE